jgi:uncharacterized protein YgiM (DUF1202 family)
MKKNLWIIFAAALSTSVLAQDASNAPALQAAPPEPTPMSNTMSMPTLPPPTAEAPATAPTTTAPKKTTTAKRKPTTTRKTVASKPKAPEPRSVPLVAGPAVVSANHVNVRSKAGLVGEVVTRVTNGSPITVLEEVHLKKSGPDEPSAWAKILLPAEAHVWVKSSLLDAANNTVNVKKVNLRAGPGENYGVLGTLNKGDAVQTVETKGEWTQIQAPANAYAFIAAQYLKQDESGAGATIAGTPTPTPTPEQPVTTTTMPEMPTVAAPPTEVPGTGPTTAGATGGGMPTMPTMPDNNNNQLTPAVQEPPPPRIVEHEGVVRGAFSIQAPSRYELVSPETKQPINYLFTTSTNLDLSRYKGMHIIVTGEEALDPRWKNTPVITIQRIQVLD